MKDVFKDGVMPAGITVTISATEGAKADPKYNEASGPNAVTLS
jgi:hypothetical protein